MAGWSRRARRSFAATVSALTVPVLMATPILVVGVSTLTPAPALAQSAGDIQWAQTILKEKGFDIGGRARGEMTPQTRAALSKYQASVGLPATGQLDKATIGKMMAERQSKAVPTMGNLTKEHAGTRPAEREVVPRAAPSQHVENGGGSVGGGAQFGSVPTTTGSRSSAPSSSGGGAGFASDEPAPQAAPRASVSATTPSGQPVPVEAPVGDGSLLPQWATGALRYVVMGVLAITVGGVGFGWWRSGRASAPVAPARDDQPRTARREPTFGGRRDELTTGPLPPLRGDRRGRR